jgi:hypothetical protein
VNPVNLEPIARRLAAIVIVVAALASPAFCQTLLDVPYLPQTEDLCGGAAAAMVMRYWGDRDVRPDAFARLVDRSAGGIRTSALVDDLRRGGWIVVSGPGSAADVTRELGRGRPVIALIQDRPGRYHYVVIVGSTAESVVYHDPAKMPDRTVRMQEFDEAWAKAGRWMLILLPKDTKDAKDAKDTKEHADESALAGDWSAAAKDARRTVARDPSDAHAWNVLAAAEYVQHHDFAALDAWNHVGKPVLDTIDVTGLQSTRYQVVANAVEVAPGALVTPAALRLAERQVRDLPSIDTATVTYRPLEDGRAQIDAAVVERDRTPSSWPSWAGIGVGAAADRQLSTTFANPTGGGDAITATWRWWGHRPLYAASYSAPAPRALGGGVWDVEASRETQTFGPASLEEIHTRAAFGMRTWITGRLHVSGSAAVESFTGRDRTPAVTGGVEYWPTATRLSLAATATRWRGFETASISGHWRSHATNTGIVWLAISGYEFASARAPQSVWPGADPGPTRDVLLRAHTMLDGGVIDHGVFGRRLGYTNLEVQRWKTMKPWPIRYAPAAFVDIAGATRGAVFSSRATQIDIGVGLRFSAFSMGVLRIDFAYGLRDGRTVASAALQ